MTPDIFDTHFHLGPDVDLPAISDRARAAGVSRMLVAGGPVGGLQTILERIAPYPHIYAAAGVHPHEAGKYDGDIAPYREWATSNPQVRAIGEIGLDYFYDYGPRDDQRRTFRAFLELAGETGLAAIIHCRDAYDDVYEDLRDVLGSQAGFVVHCFSGTPDWAERFLALGGHLSYTGLITFKKAENVRDSLRVTPLDRLMVETDSPYLAPIPHRGKTNEPAYVRLVLESAAETLAVPAAELAAITTANALRFFQIPE